MTDDRERLDPALSPPVATDEVKILDAPPADVPVVPPPLEPTADEAPTPPGPSLRERLTPFRLLASSTAVLAVVAILLGLMVFAPSVAPFKLGSARIAAEAGDVDEIEALARRFGENFMTMSYRTLDADFERVLRDTTGPFRAQLEGILEVFGDLLVKAKSDSKGDVSSVTVLSRSGDDAAVAARVNRRITNERNPNSRPTTHTLLITLIRTPSAWKVNDVTEIPRLVGPGGVTER